MTNLDILRRIEELGYRNTFAGIPCWLADGYWWTANPDGLWGSPVATRQMEGFSRTGAPEREVPLEEALATLGLSLTD